MPLQSRSDPFGELLADPARGLFMGNRGGRMHTAERTLSTRRWVSKQWICCALEFNHRRREVWGRSYTELFFLDEPTALAAGHRPCFECRRKDAKAFAHRWREAFKLRSPPRAAEMDARLHAERLNGRAKRLHRLAVDNLPDGAFVAMEEGAAYALRDNTLLRWTPSGYDGRARRPRGLTVDVLTPPATLAALAAGYQPQWHATARAKPRRPEKTAS